MSSRRDNLQVHKSGKTSASAILKSISSQLTGDVAVDGASADLRLYDSCNFNIDLGTYVDGTLALNFEHDDDDGAGSPAGTWADIPAAQIKGDLAQGVTLDGSNDEKAYKVQAINTKRHVRAKLDSSGATTTTGGIHMSVSIDRGHKKNAGMLNS